jgi:hypothetical protein
MNVGFFLKNIYIYIYRYIYSCIKIHSENGVFEIVLEQFWSRECTSDSRE